jgi:alpha-beta hydrolase superfamily lysophospholipase
LLSHSNVCAAACLLSPYLGLQIHVDRFTLILGRVVATIWPWYRFRSRVRGADLSRDDNYLTERRQDLLIQRSVTAGWYFAIQRALQQVHATASQIQVPLLVLQSELDHIVKAQATKDWFDNTTSADRTFELLPDHLHELLQETDRQATSRRILDWLDARVRK